MWVMVFTFASFMMLVMLFCYGQRHGSPQWVEYNKYDPHDDRTPLIQ